jgi:bifunctional DNase/RNase
MQNDVVAATVKGLVPTPNGCAVFIGNEEKTFVIYVDQSVGNAIQMTLDGVKKDRPLTHDLIGNILVGLGDAPGPRIVINDARDQAPSSRGSCSPWRTSSGKKIVEIDARPSDSIVLSLQQKRPIYVARAVFDAVEDMHRDPRAHPQAQAARARKGLRTPRGRRRTRLNPLPPPPGAGPAAHRAGADAGRHRPRVHAGDRRLRSRPITSSPSSSASTPSPGRSATSCAPSTRTTPAGRSSPS